MATPWMSARTWAQTTSASWLTWRLRPIQAIVVRLKYIDAFEPRWGGSYERMEAFLEESRRANLAPEKLHLQMALAESQPGDTARHGQ
jgi:hypothetical protein